MISFLKNKSKNETKKPTPPTTTTRKERFFDRLKKTRTRLGDGVANLLLGKKDIDDTLLEELETLLLCADVGRETTTHVLKELQEGSRRRDVEKPDALILNLKKILVDVLQPCERTIQIESTQQPFLMLIVGINGAGKTTTIAKLAHHYHQQRQQLMLAAGDTFRAAAIEQLQHWGQSEGIPVVAQKQGSDSASVIYDAIHSAQAKKSDILIADTAGRLHTQDHLMAELEKVVRVIKKVMPDAPHECLLVLDGTTGQNALSQAKVFHQALPLTGLIVTKLDGTAKGGIVLALARELNLPIPFIGIGEQADDLRPFNAQEFIDALVGHGP